MEMLFDLFRVIMVNIVLSGDNAVVIAMCSRALPDHLRMKAMIWGSATAILLRLAMTVAAAHLLAIPYLQCTGGLLLLWIAAKLAMNEDSAEEVDAKDSFWSAVKTILVADIVMSLDNTLAIAAVAKENLPMLAAGFLISVPLIIFGSQLILKIMNRFPFVVYGGAIIIAWTAGELIVGDKMLGVLLLNIAPEWVFNLTAVALVVGVAYRYRSSATASDIES